MSLSKTQIGFFAARIVSIYLAVHAIDIIASLGRFAQYTDMDARVAGSIISASVIYLLWALIYIAAAILFYTRAEQLSALFVGRTVDESNEGSNVDQKQVERIAFIVIGVYIIATAIPHVVNIIYSMAISQRESPRTIGDILSTSLSVVLGAYLMLGAKGLQSALNKFRDM